MSEDLYKNNSYEVLKRTAEDRNAFSWGNGQGQGQSYDFVLKKFHLNAVRTCGAEIK